MFKGNGMLKFAKIFALSLLLIGFLNATEAKKAANVEFNIKTIDGKTFKVIGKEDGILVPQLKGKVVFVEFWGINCRYCILSIPEYIKLKNEYKDKLEILAFEVEGHSTAQLKRFVKQKGMNYPVFSMTENLDFIRYISDRTGWMSKWRGGIPFLAAFDKDGRIITIQPGKLNREFLVRVIEYGLKGAESQSKDTNSSTK